MQKREPVIIAPDYTDDELYEWMRQKINAAQDLKWANEARAKQAEICPLWSRISPIWKKQRH